MLHNIKKYIGLYNVDIRLYDVGLYIDIGLYNVDIRLYNVGLYDIDIGLYKVDIWDYKSITKRGCLTNCRHPLLL